MCNQLQVMLQRAKEELREAFQEDMDTQVFTPHLGGQGSKCTARLICP